MKKFFTLRFESKHTFCKRVMRNIKCSKNVTLSLAEKRELLQSLLRTGARLRCELSLNEETEFHIHHYSVEIHQAVYNAQLGVSVTVCSSAKLKGNHYIGRQYRIFVPCIGNFRNYIQPKISTILTWSLHSI